MSKIRIRKERERITGKIAYEIAKEMNLLDKIDILRERVIEIRGKEIEGKYEGILRDLGYIIDIEKGLK